MGGEYFLRKQGHNEKPIRATTIHRTPHRQQYNTPRYEQHACLDKGYDFENAHQFVRQHGYIPHIKHRRLRNEPKVEECPIPTRPSSHRAAG
jgi:hypothetical protein